ncbi:MSMEG_0567/Sll0786 family nitrogen starvation N-acetyltransferase [Parathalassolituus penaei]|uniref:GNAT family N-acetyltransferase n=1 Tax=Parathalassolituus penaei TaxID=2997323 RepID=A0A9X3IT21_9GAMM|nr:MSMEG_0567/Sll0786 family nitrogen starvation N-acetyltransferase [Parathalassolituus penaei]MCY0965469.1 GNAT family N-acetyltransferase [Parathalassolituus penaei]
MQYPDYSDYTIKWATLPWEVEQAHALRRRVFCDEQGLFAGDDADATDGHARTLVALGNHGGWHQQVVGTVRIHREGPADENLWYGSRLAVDPAFRTQGQLGSTLIKLAVSSAHALGCQTFMATVQIQNEPLFKRLNWRTHDYRDIQGLKHAVMQADLAAYPPCFTPTSGFVLKARKQHIHEHFWPGLLDAEQAQPLAQSANLNLARVPGELKTAV